MRAADLAHQLKAQAARIEEITGVIDERIERFPRTG